MRGRISIVVCYRVQYLAHSSPILSLMIFLSFWLLAICVTTLMKLKILYMYAYIYNMYIYKLIEYKLLKYLCKNNTIGKNIFFRMSSFVISTIWKKAFVVKRVCTLILLFEMYNVCIFCPGNSFMKAYSEMYHTLEVHFFSNNSRSFSSKCSKVLADISSFCICKHKKQETLIQNFRE